MNQQRSVSAAKSASSSARNPKQKSKQPAAEQETVPQIQPAAQGRRKPKGNSRVIARTQSTSSEDSLEDQGGPSIPAGPSNLGTKSKRRVASATRGRGKADLKQGTPEAAASISSIVTRSLTKRKQAEQEDEAKERKKPKEGPPTGKAKLPGYLQGTAASKAKSGRTSSADAGSSRGKLQASSTRRNSRSQSQKRSDKAESSASAWNQPRRRNSKGREISGPRDGTVDSNEGPGGGLLPENALKLEVNPDTEEQTEEGPSRAKKSKKTGNRQGSGTRGGQAGTLAPAGIITSSSTLFGGRSSKRKGRGTGASSSATGTHSSTSQGLIKQEPTSDETKAPTNTGSCSSSSCLSGGRNNSVYPEGEGSGGGTMADNGGAAGGGGQEASGGGAAGNDANAPAIAAPTGEELEMGRLQAMLEARGLPGNILGALGPRIGGLLGRHSHSHSGGGSKVQGLLQGIQKSEDESQQLQSVIELCNLLVMGNEETLGSNFPIKEAVRALLKLMQLEHNFDIMNHAVRAITYLMEALPRSTPVVVEAIPQLLERLNRIECMDVAEQALTALELLSKRHAKSILNAGGISACLQYLDFFSLVPQRTALVVASNCCCYLSPDDFHYVKDSIPLLTQRLCLQDKKSVESVSTLFTRLVDNMLANPDKLQEITAHGLLQNVQQLLVVSPSVISTPTFISIVRMLHLLCAHSTVLAVQLHRQNIVETIRYLLVGSTAEVSGPEVELVSRTPQEQHEIVVLIGELMPRLPRDGIFEVESLLKRQPTVSEQVVWSWKDDRGIWRPYTSIDNRILEAAHQARESEVSLNAMENTYTVDMESMVQVNDDTGTSRQIHRRTSPAASQAGAAMAIRENGKDERVAFLESDPEIAEDFIRTLFPVLYEVYSSSAGPAIRHECMRSVLRMIYHSKPELLKDVLQNVSVSSHIANMLSSSDLKIVVGGLQLVRILLEKVPEVFSVYFRREGVTHQVEKLVTLPSPAISSAASPHKSASDPSLPAVGMPGPGLLQLSSAPSGYPFLFSSSHLVPPAPMPYYNILPPPMAGTTVSTAPSVSTGSSSTLSGQSNFGADPQTAPASLNLDNPLNFFAACRFSSVPGAGNAVISASSAAPLTASLASGGPTAAATFHQQQILQQANAESSLAPLETDFSSHSLMTTFKDTKGPDEGTQPSVFPLASVDPTVALMENQALLLEAPPPPFQAPKPSSEMSSNSGTESYGTPEAGREENTTSGEVLASSLTAQGFHDPIAPDPQNPAVTGAEVRITKVRSGSAVDHPLGISAQSGAQGAAVPVTMKSASKRRAHTVTDGTRPSGSSSSSTRAPATAGGTEKNNNEKRDKTGRRRASTLQEIAAKKHDREKERLTSNTPMTRSRVKGAAPTSTTMSTGSPRHSLSSSSPHSPALFQPKSLRTHKNSSLAGAGGTSNSSGRRSSSTDPSKPPASKKSSGATAFLTEKLSSFPLPRWAKPSSNAAAAAASNQSGGNSIEKGTMSLGGRKGGTFSYPTANIPLSAPTSMRQLISVHQSTASSYHSLVTSQMSIQSAANKEKVKQWIRDQSKELLDSYFAANGDKDSSEMDVLSKLTAISESLQADVDLGRKPLEELERTVVDSDVSAFEIIHSGLITTLYKYLTGSDIKFVTVEKRLRRFCSIFLNIKEGKGRREKVTIDEERGPPTLSKLVSKLNGCLNQIEQFPVKVHELPGGPQGSLRGANALRFFHSHQIKCMLRRHPSCKELREWRRGPIKVDSLAQISAIERYMVLKGYGRPRSNPNDTINDDDSSDDGGSDEDLEEALVSRSELGNELARLVGIDLKEAMGGVLSGNHRIQFMINEKALPYEMTLYQAIRQYGLTPHGTDTDTESEMSSLGYAAIWVNTHNLWYRIAPEESTDSENIGKSGGLRILGSSPDPKSKKSPNSKDKKGKSNDALWIDGVVPVRQNPLQEYLETPSLTGLDSSTVECLSLLRTLYGLNRYWWTLYKFEDTSLPSFNPVIPLAEFINSKLTAKVSRQLQDPLTVLSQQIPSWMRQLAFTCPFALSFESRQSLFYSIAFDRDRALQRLVDTVPDLSNGGDHGSERITPRLEKRKVCISREDMVKQAEHILSGMDGSSRAVLEVQYQNEEGTGLGPTLEFYALVSKELQRTKLDLWRGERLRADESQEGSNDEYFFNGQGLYPSALPRGMKQNVVTKLRSKFQFIGRVLARSIIDSRMLDLPLSPVFYKWLLGQEAALSLADMIHIDPTLLKSLQTVLSPEGGAKEIEALDLDFTLPGTNPPLELRKGGKDMAVTAENAQQYIKLVSHWILHEGVSRQMEAVIEGFEKIMPIRHLKMFYPEEMEQLFCGSRTESKPGTGHWEPGVILQHIRPDHGYTHDSPTIQWLVDVLASYTTDQQRRFLHFITGSPRLPVGGFKSLNPPFTVVRKGHEGNGNPDSYLPSVMTCVNYLKLPEYSSIEVMRERLDVATRWGQKSFHLS